MIELVNKKTGETFILPTPSNESPSIDTLPIGEPLTDEEIEKWFKFHMKKPSKLDKIWMNWKNLKKKTKI